MIKKTLFIMAICALLSTTALAIPTIEFSKAGAAGYSYDGTGAGVGTFSFGSLPIDAAFGATADTVVGVGYVNLPSLTLGSWSTVTDTGTLTPPGGVNFSITDSTGLTTYMTGTLGTGNFQAIAGTGVAYADIIFTDLTGLTITPAGTALLSQALDKMDFWGYADMNFTISYSSSIADLIDAGSDFNDSISGQIHVPAPGAILLGGIGIGLIGWLKRRRTL